MRETVVMRAAGAAASAGDGVQYAAVVAAAGALGGIPVRLMHDLQVGMLQFGATPPVAPEPAGDVADLRATIVQLRAQVEAAEREVGQWRAIAEDHGREIERLTPPDGLHWQEDRGDQIRLVLYLDDGLPNDVPRPWWDVGTITGGHVRAEVQAWIRRAMNHVPAVPEADR